MNKISKNNNSKVSEVDIVNAIVDSLEKKDFKVVTEVANFYRSADVAAIDIDDKIWIIECKVSNIKRAIEQAKTHQLSADKVFIGTFYKNTRKSTLNLIKNAGIGLIYVMPDGTIKKMIDEPEYTYPYPWLLAREKLFNRIIEAQ